MISKSNLIYFFQTKNKSKEIKVYLVIFHKKKTPIKAYSLYDIFIVVDNFSNNKIPAQELRYTVQ